MRRYSLEIDSIGEYDEIYKTVSYKKLRVIFSYFHSEYIQLFRSMNELLPTYDSTAHFWAAPSRKLIDVIENSLELVYTLKTTEFAFAIEKTYCEIIQRCRDFLRKSGGSSIPEHMPKIELYCTKSIFLPSGTISKDYPTKQMNSALTLIGEGSYAQVFKFKDEFYRKFFSLKRAKKNLDDKELDRFKLEFKQMENIHSPYIVEVYSYLQETNEYIMEYLDGTLEEYLKEHNSTMKLQERGSIIQQILKGYEYLHSKNMFHRDVSFENVLFQKYDDVNVFKISDFGLVKIPDSDLTSENSELKGCLNDPTLKTRGFANYDLLDEIYALTLLFVFVLTGKTNFGSIKETPIRALMDKGTCSDRNKRYQNLSELKCGVIACITALS